MKWGDLKTYMAVLLTAALLGPGGCKEYQPKPQKDDDNAPQPVQHVQVTRLPGAVQLKYDLPEDADLFYVEADCETTKGNIQAKATSYDNSLVLKGFGDTGVYHAKIYAVDRGENKSSAVTVSFKPLLPPVLAVKNSIEVREDFGGISVHFTNQTEANLVIYVLTPDSTGELAEAESYYTSRPEGTFSVRGYGAEKRTFSIYIRDQWNNFSDTLSRDVVPLYEMQLDKSKFSVYRLDGDAPAGYGWVMPRLWDGSLDGPNGFHTDHMGTDENPSGFPHHFTFSLGQLAKLSRFKFWQRGVSNETAFLYAHGNYRKFEIWGATDPAQDSSWNGWFKLMDCESIKPSGLPIGQVSNEDREYALRGEEYVFPLDAPAVRYIRVKILSTWGGDDYSHCMEMTFWGEPR